MIDKQKVIDTLYAALLSKIQDFATQAKMMIESRDGDTKSSAGDKYETGRAMTQIEIDKVQAQLDYFEQQVHMLKQFKADSLFVSIAPGAIFEASNGRFILGIPFGKLEVGEDVYHCISVDSPFGKACMLKKAQDKFIFMQKEITILWIQ